MRYRLASGAVVYASSSAPRIPSYLAGRIQAIAGLSDMPFSFPTGLTRRAFSRGTRAPSPLEARVTATGGPKPCAAAASAASAAGVYTADQLASAYGFSGLYAAGDLGAGETVAVFELEPFNEADVQAYDECYFQTEAATMESALHVLYVDGARPGVPSDVESTLDVEDVSSFAPRATLDVYEGPNNGTGPLDVLSAIVSQDHAQVISTSWGNCEPQDGGREVVSLEANLLEEAAAQGQSVVAASGDDGSTDCGAPSGTRAPVAAVDDPGSQPYVTSVGGTSLTALGPPPKETVWSNADGAGGGGISSNWAMPAYQSGAPPALGVIKPYSSAKPCGAPTGYCREVPDVSGDADPTTGLVIAWGRPGDWTVVGGTSLAAPLWAALIALTNVWPTCSAHPVGFVNPSLYSIAGRRAYASALNDVTRGANLLPSIPNWWHYPATVGYDLASGLGTPDAANPSGGGLVAQLCALPESGGAQYASPTRSSITASDHAVAAVSTSFSTITVTLRTRAGLPVANKRVWLHRDLLRPHLGQEDDDQTKSQDHRCEGSDDLRSERYLDSEGHLPRDGPHRRRAAVRLGHRGLRKTMRGVILAGGTGSRLHPLTRITNKHLLPIGDRPMISYGIEALVKAGVTEMMVVTGGTHAGEFLRLLSNGQEYGVERLLYAYQERAGGIAEALGLAAQFVGDDAAVVMLADNIFGRSFVSSVRRFGDQPKRSAPAAGGGQGPGSPSPSRRARARRDGADRADRREAGRSSEHVLRHRRLPLRLRCLRRDPHSQTVRAWRA